MEKKFTALRAISVIFKVLAWIVAGLTIIGFLGMLIGGAALSSFGGPYGGYEGLGLKGFGGAFLIAYAFVVLVWGALMAVSLLAASDMILVILAIEENTRSLKPQTPQG